jgi:hypothetical protein
MEVLKHTVNILKNMSMYPETAPSVFVVPQGAVDVMVDLLQNFRETDEHGIYVTVAQTLLLQSRYPTSMKLLRTTKDAAKRMSNIQALMDRKLALDMKAKRLTSEKKSKLYEATVMLRSLLARLQQA